MNRDPESQLCYENCDRVNGMCMSREGRDESRWVFFDFTGAGLY
jgi:hypothetical protein